jgi:hypothetical protein
MNETKRYWLSSEMLVDSTVREVITEWHGCEVISHRSGSTQWKLALTQEAHEHVTNRYCWQLTEAAIQ